MTFNLLKGTKIIKTVYGGGEGEEEKARGQEEAAGDGFHARARDLPNRVWRSAPATATKPANPTNRSPRARNR